MKTKLFERLVTKFSIKVNELAKYLGISKASVYNYRNLDEFSKIPNDKQYKIFFLFGKETEEDLELLLDENDKNSLKNIAERINGILEDTAGKRTSFYVPTKNIYNDINSLPNLDELSKKMVMERILGVLRKIDNLEIKAFLDYLDIYNSHLLGRRDKYE